MTGNSKRRLIFFLCGILVFVLLQGQVNLPELQAKSKPKTTLIIGDSIPYGMALRKKYGTGVDGADKVYWLTEGGVTINLLHPDFKIRLGRVMPKRVVNTFTKSGNFDLLKEVKAKKIEDIVVMLGANWSGEKSARLTVKCLKKLAQKSGCRVYYVNILPYVNKGFYKDKTYLIPAHNKITAEGFKKTGITYIDAYGIVKSIKNYQSLTWDGIHYSNKAYNPLFKKILSFVKERKEKEKKNGKKTGKKKGKEKTDKKKEKDVTKEDGTEVVIH